jgi:hypothetical protein
MPRRIRVFSLDYLRRFLVIHERSMWNLMAGMAYACPIGLFPTPDELAEAEAEDWHDAYARPDVDIPEVRLTEAECRIWDQLCQELSAERPE